MQHCQVLHVIVPEGIHSTPFKLVCILSFKRDNTDGVSLLRTLTFARTIIRTRDGGDGAAYAECGFDLNGSYLFGYAIAD